MKSFEFSESSILYTIITLVLLENTLEIYLALRQVKVYKTAKKVPNELAHVMKKDDFEKARIYGLDKEQFGIFKGIICDVIIIIMELYFGILAILWHKSQDIAEQLNMNRDSEVQVSCIFVIVTNTINIIKDIPFKIYGTFVLEEKHGFNKQTAGFFIKDQIKAYVVGQLISVPIAASVVYIVQIGGDYFFVWLWLFTGIVLLVLLTIYPIFIAPLFDKYRELDEGALRKSIEKLASELKFPLTKLYIVEGSKRSAHSNAYFYGLWRSKRIVLFDTLLKYKGKKYEDLTEEERLSNDNEKGCDDSEVLAVLAHELGHWKLGHVTKNIIFSQIHVLLLFFVFGYLFKNDPLYRAVGFYENERPILVGLLLILTYVMAVYNAIISFGMTIVSRRFEYQADAFAKQLGYSKELCSGLIKLNLDNLSFPIFDWMYSTWNHSHPSILQRIDRLKQTDKKKTN